MWDICLLFDGWRICLVVRLWAHRVWSVSTCVARQAVLADCNILSADFMPLVLCWTPKPKCLHTKDFKGDSASLYLWYTRHAICHGNCNSILLQYNSQCHYVICILTVVGHLLVGGVFSCYTPTDTNTHTYILTHTHTHTHTLLRKMRGTK